MEVSPNLTKYGEVEDANFYAQAEALAKAVRSQLSGQPLEAKQRSLKDFYMTDPISRASLTMAKCVQAVNGAGSKK